jgi:hypothetical protein
MNRFAQKTGNRDFLFYQWEQINGESVIFLDLTIALPFTA